MRRARSRSRPPGEANAEANVVPRPQVYADATLVFPLVIAATFGKAHWAKQAAAEAEGGRVEGTQAA